MIHQLIKRGKSYVLLSTFTKRNPYRKNHVFIFIISSFTASIFLLKIMYLLMENQCFLSSSTQNHAESSIFVFLFVFPFLLRPGPGWGPVRVGARSGLGLIWALMGPKDKISYKKILILMKKNIKLLIEI